MPEDVYLGYAFRYQISEQTRLPHQVQIRCWKCLTFDNPSNHNTLTCYRRRRQVIHEQQVKGHFVLPPITPVQSYNHNRDFSSVFLAILSLLDVHPFTRAVSPCPFPVQENVITSTTSHWVPISSPEPVESPEPVNNEGVFV